MREVLNQVAQQILAGARLEGARDLAPLFAGLPFDEQSLARRPFGRIDWEPFTLLLDRLAELLGGPETFRRLAHHFYKGHPPMAGLLRLVAGPKELYRLVYDSIVPWLWPTHSHRHAFLPGDRLRLEYDLPAGARGSLPFFWGTQGADESIPAFLGLPHSVAEVAERTPHRMVMTLRLPPSRTLAARLRPARALLRSLELEWAERREELLAGLTDLGTEGGGAPLGIERAQIAWRLTPREREVVSLAIEGLSNRAIAQRLGCAPGTVEAHLSHVFAKAQLEGRLELMKRLLRAEG